MDIWGQIYIGKRWVEDDGAQACEVQASKEWHVKTAHKIRVEDTPAFMAQFEGMGAEVARMVAMQLLQMRDELLYLVKYGLEAKEAADEKAGPESKKGPDTGAE